MSDDEILGDHRRDRTTLVPPLVDAVGDSLAPVRWSKDRMPDFLWIGLSFEELGGRRTVEIIKRVAEEAQDLHGEQDFILTSEFDELLESELDELRENIPNDILEDLKSSLNPLIANYPSFPMTSLFGEIPESDEAQIEYLAEIVDKLSDRHSNLSTYVQGVYVGSLMATGRMVIPGESVLTEINEVFRYPDTELSRKLAATVRASTKANNAAQDEGPNQSDWSRRFWNRGYELTDCIFPQELDSEESQSGHINPDQEFFEGLVAIGSEYDEDLRKSILELWWAAEFDAEFTGKHEVLDGLLMRQVNLVTSIVRSPEMWSQDIGMILLRCMCENQITLEWLNQEGEREHYQDFIEYGLGQEKLYLKHSQSMLSDFEDNEIGDIEDGMDQLEKRIEAQKATYLLPVDVGHWANKNTRELAEEADCKEDLYDIRFQKYSGSVHGQWNVIEKQNLVVCQNPLHQYHKIPEFRPVTKNPFTLVEAGNMMNRSFTSWMEARQIDEDEHEIPDLAGTMKEYLREYGIDIPNP